MSPKEVDPANLPLRPPSVFRAKTGNRDLHIPNAAPVAPCRDLHLTGKSSLPGIFFFSSVCTSKILSQAVGSGDNLHRLSPRQRHIFSRLLSLLQLFQRRSKMAPSKEVAAAGSNAAVTIDHAQVCPAPSSFMPTEENFSIKSEMVNCLG